MERRRRRWCSRDISEKVRERSEKRSLKNPAGTWTKLSWASSSRKENLNFFTASFSPGMLLTVLASPIHPYLLFFKDKTFAKIRRGLRS